MSAADCTCQEFHYFQIYPPPLENIDFLLRAESAPRANECACIPVRERERVIHIEREELRSRSHIYLFISTLESADMQI
jgi:hypothetical protein